MKRIGLWFQSGLSLLRPLRSALGQKQTREPVRFWEQVTNRHSDLMHKSGPLLGPFLIKLQGVSIYNCIDKLYRRRPLLGTTCLRIPLFI